MAILFGVKVDRLETEIQSGDRHTTALRFDDHLLRRFGQADLIEPVGDPSPQLRLRPEADEVWVVLQGSITFDLFDRRTASPTRGQTQSIDLTAPSRLLIPFGVAMGWKSLTGPVQLLRLATHSPEESAVDFIAWGEA